MQPNLRRSRLALISIAVVGALFLAQPAIAQTVTLGSVTTDANGAFSAVVTIPPGTAPGIYDLSAVGLGPLVAPYPPTSTGSLSVSSTVVVSGGSLTASGGGFAANTNVVLSLTFVGEAAGTTLRIAQANTTRVLAARIKVVAPEKQEGEGEGTINITNNVSCVSDATATSTASSGEYRIAQTTITNNNVAECRSEAVAHAAQKAETPVTPPATKVLVRTGADALPLLAAASATILMGMVLLTAGRRRDTTEPI